MGIHYGHSGKDEYINCVIRTYERNSYEDSDWYAVCWDEKQDKVVHIEYDTTRFGTDGSYARVDCSLENLRKAYRYYYNIARVAFDNKTNIENAKLVSVGDYVRVVYGRKIPKGTTGKVFWKGVVYNPYSYRDEARVGLIINGNKRFLSELYVEPIDWEDRLITGKKRKLIIRKTALNQLGRRETALMPLAERKYVGSVKH